MINTMRDNPMQSSIDIILGKHLSTGYSSEQRVFLDQNLKKLIEEYSVSETLKVGVCTWNMGGVKPFEHVDLKDWLFAGITSVSQMPEVLVIGIQEMIPLKASRLFTSNRNETDWVKNTISKNLSTYAN